MNVIATNGEGTDKLELEQITLGMKNRFFDNRLQANIEIFDTAYHNRSVDGSIPDILFDSSSEFDCASTNGVNASYFVEYDAVSDNGCIQYLGTTVIPDLKSSGVDIELTFLLTDYDRIDLSIEYLDSAYDTAPELDEAITTAYIAENYPSVPADVAAVLVNDFNQAIDSFVGLRLRNSSEWSGNLSYSHEFMLESGGSITPRVSAVYKSTYWTVNGPNADIYLINDALSNGSGRFDSEGNFVLGIQPSYSLFDAYLTWISADGRFTTTGYIKNIENEAVLEGAGSRHVYLNNPRTYGITFSASF